jgi:hypothetical protein
MYVTRATGFQTRGMVFTALGFASMTVKMPLVRKTSVFALVT